MDAQQWAALGGLALAALWTFFIWKAIDAAAEYLREMRNTNNDMRDAHLESVTRRLTEWILVNDGGTAVEAARGCGAPIADALRVISAGLEDGTLVKVKLRAHLAELEKHDAD